MIDEQLALADDGNPHAADNGHDDPSGQLNTYRAIMIAEGAEEADEETQIAAWQYLVDNGTVWHLQGAFGRQATRMIEDGIIHANLSGRLGPL